MNIINIFFALVIVYLLLFLGIQIYNYFNKVDLPESVRNMIVDESDHIPPIIHMIYKNKDVSPKIFENWQRLNPEYKINFVVHDPNNNEALEYIRSNYGQEFADYFGEIPFGPLLADFWRLCVLYMEGGVYTDIDQELLVPIKEFLPRDVTLCTLIASWNDGKIANGFIACTRGNPIIKDCLRRMYAKRRGAYPWRGIKYFSKYWGLSGTYTMYDSLAQLFGTRNLKPGITTVGEQRIFLIKEKCKKEFFKMDQSDCHITVDGKRVMNMRYPDYDKNRHQFF